MAQERDTISISDDGTAVTLATPADSRVNDEEIDKYLARFVEVLDRGIMNDRLAIPNLPRELYGEWVANDPAAIEMAKTLGYQIDEKYAGQSALHSDGSGKPIVGDVVFMTMPRRLHEGYERLRQERFNKQYNRSHSEKARQQAEAAALRQDGKIDTYTNIDTARANGMQINEAINATRK